MLDCTTDHYETLYLPWLATGAEALLDLAQLQPGERLLDLCGGTGVVTRDAMRRRPSLVTLFDINPRPRGKLAHGSTFEVVRGRAERLPCYFRPEAFDVVVCRQAIGYLNLDAALRSVAFVLAPGGRFVFNSFQKPKRFGWSRYNLHHFCTSECTTMSGPHAHAFLEAHFSMFNRILHLQCRLWEAADLTYFRYYSPQQIQVAAERYFDIVEKHTHGRGLHWLCRKGEKP